MTQAYREEVNTLHHGLQNPPAVVVETSNQIYLQIGSLLDADRNIQLVTFRQ